MAAPAPYYFQHALDFLKGWPSPTAVDVSGVLSSSVTATLYGGRVVHVDSVAVIGQGATAERRLLFAAGALGTQMPIFAIPGPQDFDVANPSPGGGTNAYDWYAIAPNGHMSGLVAVGSFELETTEYDTVPSYGVNDLLHSPTEGQITGADKSVAGMLFNHRNWPGGNAGAITQYVDNVVGVVSRGAHLNHLRQNVLTFWPYFLPGQDSTH